MGSYLLLSEFPLMLRRNGITVMVRVSKVLGLGCVRGQDWG